MIWSKMAAIAGQYLCPFYGGSQDLRIMITSEIGFKLLIKSFGTLRCMVPACTVRLDVI